jgi:hypothetical protein
VISFLPPRHEDTKEHQKMKTKRKMPPRHEDTREHQEMKNKRKMPSRHEDIQGHHKIMSLRKSELILGETLCLGALVAKKIA